MSRTGEYMAAALYAATASRINRGGGRGKEKVLSSKEKKRRVKAKAAKKARKKNRKK